MNLGRDGGSREFFPLSPERHLPMNLVAADVSRLHLLHMYHSLFPFSSGIVKKNVAPSFGLDSAQIRPP